MSKNTLLSNLINYISSNSSGNVVIAAPSSGLALDVTGTGRFTGAFTGTSATFSENQNATTTSTFQNTNTTDSSSRQKLNIVAGNVGISLQAIYGDHVYINPLTAVNTYIGHNNILIVSSGGNVGIGASSPGYKIDVSASNQYSGRFNTSDTTGSFITFSKSNTSYGYAGSAYHIVSGGTNGDMAVSATSNLVFGSGASLTERMRINAGGDVKFALNITFGTTSEMYIGRGNAISGAFNSYDFVMSNFQSSGRIVMTASTSGSSGMYLAQGSNSWAAWSDERLKTDLMPIENASEKVSQLRAVIGRYKTDDESKKRSFLIAQDVLAVLPEATDLDERTGMYAVQYTDVIPLLVASIKELKAELDLLKQQ